MIVDQLSQASMGFTACAVFILAAFMLSATELVISVYTDEFDLISLVKNPLLMVDLFQLSDEPQVVRLERYGASKTLAA